VSLVLVTDLQRAGWQDQQPLSLPPGMHVEVRAAGELAGNLAVRAVDVEPDRVVAELQNDWTAQKTGQVRLLQNGRTIAAASYSLAPSSAAEVPIPAKIPATGALAVAIEDSGGIPADDVRYRILGGGSQPGMLIVAGGAANGFYITRALEAIGDDDDGFAVDRVSGAAFSSMKSDALAGTALVVLASTRGIDRRGRDHLTAFTRAGGGLLVTGAPDVEGTLLSNAFAWTPALSTVDVRNEPLTFAATDPRHPIFQPFGPLLANLGQVRFERTWRVVPNGWRVIARFSDGSPALVERVEGKGRVLLFASDLDRRWNDFPLNPAFVPFVIEAARYTAGPRRHANDFTVGAVPPGVEPRPGVYEIDREKGSVAVNVDPREGALGRLTLDEFQGMLKPSEAAPAAVRLQAQHIEAGQSYWRYGLLLMLAALVAESVVGRVRA
jgi:hypothetical protein